MLRAVKASLTSDQLPQCVPTHSWLSADDISRLEDFIRSSHKLFVLTGAGVSTESGIKDYRSEDVGLYATTTHRPMNYSDFLRSSGARQRYWARNTTAWPVFSTFKPNVTHKFLATLEHRERLHWLVTQNVDSLHHKAGSRRLTELHGSVASVICLSCHSMTPRDELQEKIFRENPNWSAESEGQAPDADVFVAESAVRNFKTPHCDSCGGILKPNVVFFGDSVPKRRVEEITQRLVESDACMVVGSTLETYSSFRYVRHCSEVGKPVLVLNIGPTRADSLADVKIGGRCGEAFQVLLDRGYV